MPFVSHSIDFLGVVHRLPLQLLHPPKIYVCMVLVIEILLSCATQRQQMGAELPAFLEKANQLCGQYNELNFLDFKKR